MMHTGIDPTDVALIPEGSVITRRYFCFPDTYSVNKDGKEYGGYREALHAAILDKSEEVKKHRERFEEKVLRYQRRVAEWEEHQALSAIAEGSEGKPEPGPEPVYTEHPETIWVDSRWIISHRDEGGHQTAMSDLMVSRTRYDDLAEAVDHLDRLSILGEY